MMSERGVYLCHVTVYTCNDVRKSIKSIIIVVYGCLFMSCDCIYIYTQ